MENVSNRALIGQLFISAEEKLEDANFDFESWSEWYAVVQGMSAPEKMVYIIVKMNQTVTNGGFAEFYENSFGVFAPEIIYVLTEIKATATAGLIANSLPIVNPTGLLDDAYKALVFNIQLTEEQRAQLYAQDIGYDQLQDVENLEDLLGGYLQGAVG